MKEWFVQNLQNIFERFHEISVLTAIVDFILVFFLIWGSVFILKGTKTIRIILGLLLLSIFYAACKLLQLRAVTWILDQFFDSFILVILILFQEEIRRALSRIGINLKFLTLDRFSEEDAESLNQIVKSVGKLSTQSIGALIVIERSAEVLDYIQGGTELDSKVNDDLIFSIFLPYSPLHDGALLIKKNRIAYAGCVLPLSNDPNISKSLGTRHRAAIGLSERTDAVIIVVSETDGKISLCYEGLEEKIVRGLNLAALHNELAQIFGISTPPPPKTNPKASRIAVKNISKKYQLPREEEKE